MRARLVSSIVLPFALLAACGDDDPAGGGGSGADAPGAGGAGAGGAGGFAGSPNGGAPQGGEGGSGGTLLPAPPLRNPVTDWSDDQIAFEALLLMGYQPVGATTNTCTQCHSLNSGLLQNWLGLTQAAEASCFADTSIPSVDAAGSALSCLRVKPENDQSVFSTPKLGIYAAAAHLDWFQFAFDRAYGADLSQPEYDEFVNKVAMPKVNNGGTPLQQGEFDIVAEWFARGLPYLEDFVPEEPPLMGCTGSITPEVSDFIDEIALSNWRAQNVEDSLLMFGCAGAPTSLDCLSTYPTAAQTPFGAGWEYLPGAKLRVLRTSLYSSSYWTRSSADGRYVGHGGGPNGGSTIVDLLMDTQIHAQASYDPAFFPDNRAFMFQGTSMGTGICPQPLLATDSDIAFTEPGCSSGAAQIGLYQHVGAALDGGDYWAVDSSFVSDDGGHESTDGNPAAFFGAGSDIVLTPLINTGSDFVPKPSIETGAPFEGDTVMSPSGRLLISRIAGSGWKQNGFRLRRVDATPNGSSYDVALPEIGRYCINGGKPGFSFDERWVVFHKYIDSDDEADAQSLGFTGTSDPGFQAYAANGVANVYLLDLVTGISRRVTNLAPGQYALFPHFRSDGWIYFMVRTLGTQNEHIVASDAALVIEAAQN
jgi:hypothetical protein